MSQQAPSFQMEDNVSEKTRYRDLVKRLLPYLARHKKLFSLLVVIVCVHTTLGRLLPTVIGYAVDHVIVAKQSQLLLKVCLAYLGIEILRFIFVLVETYYFQVLGLKIIYELRSHLYSHIQNLPVRFFDKTPVGRLVTRLTNDFASLSDLFTAGLISVFTDSLSLIAITIAMSFISIKLTLVVMSVAPLMLWASLKLSEKARGTLRVIKKRLAIINSFVAENISGMKVIQLYAREKLHRERFQNLNNEYREVQLENLKYLSWLYPVLNGFNALTVAMALYYGGLLTDDNALAVGSLVAFLMHVQDFLPPIRNILEKYQTFQSSLASAERIFSLLSIPQEKQGGQKLPSERTMGHIEFKNVSFAYDEKVGPVLKNISFEIKPGQSVALVGATGSGKSTVINLIQKFYDLKQTPFGQGQILLDGYDIETIQATDLRRRLGVVHQDFFIFRGSLASNISLNDPSISSERIRGAALRAHCEELINKQKGGLDALIQEKGANLSTGEKQLLSFARALAFNPDILVLDEATAHIDSHSEALIQQATREVTSGRTSIIIAHRLSTILKCDRILVFDRGELVEQGRHEELLQAQGPYANLYNLQLKKQLTH